MKPITKLMWGGVLCLLLTVFSTAQAQELQSIDTKLLDGDKFEFPDDLDASKLNILLLAISEEQDNGTWQGDALADWYVELDKAGLLNADVKAWHFSVLKVPFFVKGLIRGGLADKYEDKLPMNQSAPLYVKDAQKFATAAGIELDMQPTILLMTPDGTLHEQFKGEFTPETLAALTEARAKYVAGP